MTKYFLASAFLLGTGFAMILPAAAQTATKETRASAEDPNDKAAQDRSFEETRKHMELHSEWSKKTGKMSDN